jgi:predicted dehydrogenase
MTDNPMKTPLRLAFAGFRHSHIFDLYKRALSHSDIVIAGTWENDPAASLLPGRNIATTHKSVDALLAECDAVAIGDCYGRRGPLVVQALRAGKHVIADKPLCTSLSELEEIRLLAAAGGRSIGMMLDMRDAGNIIALREVVRSGRIGTVQTVGIAGQHPLKRGTRPAWYFEPGMHGGTLNDLAIHVTDLVPWVTGLQITGIDGARTWNVKATQAPHFKDCGQFMLRLSNGGGVMGDVSYLAPDKCGYAIPNYWRISLHGTNGLAETAWNVLGVVLADDASDQPQMLPPAVARPGGYLEDFLAEIIGQARPDGLTTASCLAATRLALELQARAET